MTATARVQHLAECDRSVQMSAIASSAACEAGRVILLDFSPVREKLGSRWALRCESVWDHMERTLRRHIPPQAMFCRADQTSYLISFVNIEKLGAQALGFRILEDVMTHFLGSCSVQELIVKTVTSLSDNEITASKVQLRDEHLRFTPTLGAPKPLQPPLLPQLTHILEDQLQQSLGFDHVFNLKMERPVALRVSSSLLEPITRRPLKAAEQAALATRLLLKADLHTFELLNHLFSNMPPKLIIAPLSIQSLTHTKSRVAVFDGLNRLNQDTKSRFIIEIYGLEDGMPTSRVAETMALLKPFCRSIMARITSTRSAILNVRAARVPAVSTCAVDTGGNSAKLAASLLAFGEAARGLAPTLMVTDLPDAGFLSVCAVAGLTHASVRSLAGPSAGL